MAGSFKSRVTDVFSGMTCVEPDGPGTGTKVSSPPFKVITPFGLVVDPEAKSRGRAIEQPNAEARRAEPRDIQPILSRDPELGEGWIRARQINKSPSEDERTADRQLLVELRCAADCEIIRRHARIEECCKRP